MKIHVANQKLRTVIIGILVIASSVLLTPVNAKEVERMMEVSILATDEQNAEVTIDKNGERFRINLPKAVLANKQKLQYAISQLPQSQQHMVMEALYPAQKTDSTQQKKIEVLKPYLDSFQWIEKGGSGINQQALDESAIIELSKNSSDGAKSKKIIKKKMKLDGENVFITHQGQSAGSITMIKHLLKQGTFTSDELDEIQHILDEKR
ncbi:hypothetical protein [Thalassotalea aquiviva]|uniref:hypothetical protein n=1 Tax=Thalassotalea aquiviva TaxID=3242415 RepID=UPI00352A8FAB